MKKSGEKRILAVLFTLFIVYAINADKARQESEDNKKNTQDIIEGITSRMEESIEKSNSVEQIRELTDNILTISSQTNLSVSEIQGESTKNSQTADSLNSEVEKFTTVSCDQL